MTPVRMRQKKCAIRVSKEMTCKFG